MDDARVMCARVGSFRMYGMYIREDRYNMYICVSCVCITIMSSVFYCPRCALDASFECRRCAYMHAVYLCIVCVGR